MSAIVEAITDYLTFFILYPWTLAVKLLEWAVDFVTENIVQVAYTLLPEGVAEYLHSADFAEINSMLDTATWWIPVWGIAAIYLQAYALVGGIRLARWIIHLTPFIG